MFALRVADILMHHFREDACGVQNAGICLHAQKIAFMEMREDYSVGDDVLRIVEGPLECKGSHVIVEYYFGRV